MVLLGMVLLASHAQLTPIVVARSGSFNVPSGVAASPDVNHPAIVIRGDGLVVDFGNRLLRGSPDTVDPDKREGTAVMVEGNNVTLRHAKIRGYKVAVLARNCSGLKIEDCDFSYNWKQHLKSTPEKEDESDWMSFHKNEEEEWLHTYAGAVYLSDCDKFELRNLKITGGQCGLMMTRCTHGLIWNSDFSFLSGLGIGMYRSSENRIMHNKVDWCVRGYSDGVYNRGQDSAGILVYEQSNRNVFAYNSVTHGGDGFFLWAGQSTMDTGQGGCNDNLVYGNDFSSAPTNGIEATFSRNAFVNNKVLECWHGVWGGYSFDTRILGNVFGYNAEAISIEHGQSNSIVSNSFWRDQDVVGLWANSNEDPNWGYPKHRDTRSRDYTIRDNYIGNIPGTVFHIRATSGATLTENRIAGIGQLFREETPNPNLVFKNNFLSTNDPALKDRWVASNQVDVSPQYVSLPSTMKPSGLLEAAPVDAREYAQRFDVTWNPFPSGDARRKEVESLAPLPLKGGKDPFLTADRVRGRRYILVDEWGPYDFRRPILRPVNPTQVAPGGTQRFEILGPRGSWKLIRSTGAVLSAKEGAVPGSVDVTIPAGQTASLDLVLEYRGGETVDYRGITTPRGQPMRFGFEKFMAPIDWDVRFFRWAISEDPADPHASPKDIGQVFQTTPILEKKLDRLDLAGSSLLPGLPADHYAIQASGTFTVPAGEYELDVTTDDGARVSVDGREVIGDAWHYQGPTSYSAVLHLDGSQHRVTVQHFQIDGYAVLKVELKPRK